jgi:hypothetical protein
MSTDIVKISNKSYTISQSIEDRARRRKYFNTFKEDKKKGDTELKPDETQVLTDLGIDATMTNTLKMYLPTFFDNLHSCSSDSSLVLDKKCNIPYYVLWSIMLANKESTDKRLRDNKEKYSPPTSLLGVAVDGSTLRGLRPKEITDEYDKLFQLMVTTSPVISDSTNFGYLLKLNVTDDKKRGVNAEYAGQIDSLFTLILTTPEAPRKSKIKVLAEQIIKLDRERRHPRYTFSQETNTCATDSLFTILLQSDKIKDLFIQNITSLYRTESNKLVPINNVLHCALKRYITMLTLESSDPENKSTRLETVNLGRENPYGELMLKDISKDEACIGAKRSDIIRYLEELKAQLASIPNMKLFNFFYGQLFKNNYANVHGKSTINKNLNSIKALYITHPINSDPGKSSGHAISILKIRNEWYISDNEVGLLHKINDNKFIPVLFYKLYQANLNPIHEICQMWHTTDEQKSAHNLLYFFVFDIGGKQYIYPNSNVPGAKDINTPIVTAERCIVFTYTEDVKDPLLEDVSKKLLQPENEFKRFIESSTPASQATR